MPLIHLSFHALPSFFLLVYLLISLLSVLSPILLLVFIFSSSVSFSAYFLYPVLRLLLSLFIYLSYLIFTVISRRHGRSFALCRQPLNLLAAIPVASWLCGVEGSMHVSSLTVV
jgi:hypothetical protein